MNLGIFASTIILISNISFGIDSLSPHKSPVNSVTSEVEYNWRAGGRIGLIGKFIRTETTDWKVDSSYALSSH
jgi:hypothetical protein